MGKLTVSLFEPGCLFQQLLNKVVESCAALGGLLSLLEAAFLGLHRSRGSLSPSGLLLMIAFSNTATGPPVSLFKLAAG